MLQRAYEKPNRSLPGVKALDETLLSPTRRYKDILFALDALDERLSTYLKIGVKWTLNERERQEACNIDRFMEENFGG